VHSFIISTMFSLIFRIVRKYNYLVKISLKIASAKFERISPKNQTSISLAVALGGGVYGLATASGIGGLCVTFVLTMFAFFDIYQRI
jgi:hypothetical protein